jgi:murein DD-endopeptidase MepM/ murein hydrolase activator NlpD
MDEYVARPRYARHNLPSKRRKKNVREGNKVFDGITRQLVIAILILLVIGIFQSVNTPVSAFINQKIKDFLFQDLNINEISTGIENYFNNTSGNKKVNVSDANANNIAAPALSDAVSSINEGYTSESQPLQSQKSADNAITAIKAKYTFVTPALGTLSSPYGNRMSPVKNVMEFHKGVDIEAASGEPVKAALAGKVLEASTDTTYGNCIKISSSDGILTTYAHCSELVAVKSQEVKAGDIIAKVGNTGISAGSHLHFEVSKDNISLDPMNFIKLSA